MELVYQWGKCWRERLVPTFRKDASKTVNLTLNGFFSVQPAPPKPAAWDAWAVVAHSSRSNSPQARSRARHRRIDLLLGAAVDNYCCATPRGAHGQWQSRCLRWKL